MVVVEIAGSSICLQPPPRTYVREEKCNQEKTLAETKSTLHHGMFQGNSCRKPFLPICDGENKGDLWLPAKIFPTQPIKRPYSIQGLQLLDGNGVKLLQVRNQWLVFRPAQIPLAADS